ncbi:hypothetical protein DB345_09950 [Spartobacteria bacterium LR76]|nr:hypothetical protein DB345_09950 [Spartobacteria bacterium LR76]
MLQTFFQPGVDLLSKASLYRALRGIWSEHDCNAFCMGKPIDQVSNQLVIFQYYEMIDPMSTRRYSSGKYRRYQESIICWD